MPVLPLLQATAPDLGRFQNVYDLILSGGPMMVPIALCSIVALAYIVERVARLSPSRLVPGDFETGLNQALVQGPAQALEYCEKQPKAAAARVLGAGLRRIHATRADIERAVEDAGGREVTALSRRLRPLVIVTALAPLLGLIGTVTGMIESFQVMASQKGLGRPELLAGGISQALVTTAAGLFVAVPTQVAYYWLRAKIDRFSAKVELVFDATLGKYLDAREAAKRQEAA